MFKLKFERVERLCGVKLNRIKLEKFKLNEEKKVSGGFSRERS